MARAKQIVVGSRGDALSAIHLERACAALREAHPHAAFVVAGNGDASRAPRSRAVASAARRGAATCVGEIARRTDARRECAALIQRVARGEIDAIAVDARFLPLPLGAGIDLAAVLERTNPFDVLVSPGGCILDEQPENACIAASDAVKRGQLLYYRSDLRLVGGDENFDRLFAAMQRGSIGGFVLPAVDVEALGQQQHVAEVFTTSICTPPAGQGALALLARRDRRDVCALLHDCNDASAFAEVELERMLVEALTKDGRGPVGVLGNVEAHSFELEAAIAAPDGTEKIANVAGGSLADRVKIVQKLAAELLASGGDEIIASTRRQRGSV